MCFFNFTVMLKYIILNIILLAIPINGLGKTLSNDYEIKKADSLYHTGSKDLQSGNYPEALLNLEKSLNLYKKLGENKSIGNTFSLIATTHYFQGNYSEALSYYEKTISFYTKANYLEGVSKTHNNIGAIYYFLGNYSKAISCYQKTLKFQEKENNQELLAAINQNIGVIYIELGDYDNALNYITTSLEINKLIDNQNNIFQNLNALGEIYNHKTLFIKANEYFNQSLKIAEEIDDQQKKVEVLFNMGNLFTERKEYQKALDYYDECLKISKEISSKRYESTTLISLGDNYHLLNQNQKAIQHCLSGLSLANELGAISVKKDACDCLYNTYKKIGNNKKALSFYELSIAYNDSLKAEETSNQILNMEFEKQMLLDSIAQVEKENQLKILHLEEVQRKEKQRNIILISAGLIVLFAVGLWSRLRFVRKSKAALQIEKDRSEALLLNILPEEIAEELKANGYVVARDFDLVSILFTDFKSFTKTSTLLTPQELVEEINVCFKKFDQIIEKYELEKIKTIGDSYMAAGGLPEPDKNAIKNIVLAALDMQEFIKARKVKNDYLQKPAFEMRLGIHAGPIVAGIVGIKKFQYDVWGDTVNTASRIESNGEIGKVNISEIIYHLIKEDPDFSFEYRGLVNAKGKGKMKMYFVEKSPLFELNEVLPQQKKSSILEKMA